MATKKKATSAAHKTKRSPKYVSFRPAKSDRPFISFDLTLQTFYWTVLALVTLALGAYITVLQIRINSLFDEIETLQAQTQIK